MKYALELPRDMNKCPIHRTWVSTFRPAGSKKPLRWCDLCRVELRKEEARQAKAAGAPVKQKLKIITI